MDENRSIDPEKTEVAQTPETPARKGRKKGKEKEKKTLKQEIKEWVVALGFAVIVVMIIQFFLFRIIRVDGQSMETTLHNGERLFVNVAEVRFKDSVPRNSVVICHYPNRGLTYFVKRVVAVPGDTIYRRNGVTHVVYAQDGETVDVELDDRYGMYYIYGSPDDYDAYELGEDEYFVVGDNRYNSHDSRDWNDSDDSNDVGPISRKKIIGIVHEVIWPIGSVRAVE